MAKLTPLETREEGLGRYRLSLDGKTAGVVERFRPLPNTPSFTQWRFKATPGGTLMPTAMYLTVANSRAECVEEAEAVTRAIWADDERRHGHVAYLPAAEMLDDLKEIRRLLDKSFDGRGGGHGAFTSYEADLSGQRNYVLDKLRKMGFDSRVLHALAFGASQDWQREEPRGRVAAR